MTGMRHIFAAFLLALAFLLPQPLFAECQAGSAAGRLTCGISSVFGDASTQAVRRQADDAAELARRQASDAQQQLHEAARQNAAFQTQRHSQQVLDDAAAMAASRRSQDLVPSSAVNRNQLNKQLASQDQLNQVGTDIAGGTATMPFRGAQNASQQHGGNASDWVKKSSNSHQAPDGTRFETHWMENQNTGQRERFKTKLPDEK